MDSDLDQNPIPSKNTNDKRKKEAVLVQGSLWHAIWIMSWPLLLLMVSNAIVGVVDVQVAQVFGASAQAAVGLADQIVFLFIAAVLAASIGTNALVSRALGAEELDKAILTQGQALLFALLMGVLLTIASLLFANQLTPFFSSDPAVISLTKPYLNVYSLYFCPFASYV